MSDDPVERARLAWLGARYRFEQALDREGNDEEYRRARDALQRARDAYDRLAAAERWGETRDAGVR